MAQSGSATEPYGQVHAAMRGPSLAQMAAGFGFLDAQLADGRPRVRLRRAAQGCLVIIITRTAHSEALIVRGTGYDAERMGGGAIQTPLRIILDRDFFRDFFAIFFAIFRDFSTQTWTTRRLDGPAAHGGSRRRRV